MKEKSFPEDRIQHISALIMATKMGSEPKTDFEKIIKDGKTLKIFTVVSKGHDKLKRAYGS